MNTIKLLLTSTILYNLILLNSISAHAQITPDSSLGNESSQVNPNVLIKGSNADQINGGATRGSNLFHSFSEFNISDGQRVYFANPSGVLNILTRVTGKNSSSILGTLGVDGNANLFLMNPNGILFGKNASLDVQGSFVGTTANGLKFGNQGVFSATNPEAPALLTINPSVLWFNQLNQGVGIQNNGGLQVPVGRSLALVGGNVNVDGGILFAPGGKIDLGGLAEAGNIELQQEGNIFNFNFPSTAQRADVSLNNGANVNVISTGGGNVAINARNLNISGVSVIGSGIIFGEANSKAGNIDINATDTITVDGTSSTTANSAIFNALGGGLGNAGNITINTGSLKVIGNAQIGSFTNGEGSAGNVTIKAKDTVSFSGTNSGVLSAVAFLGVGNGANINIQAREIYFADNAVISTSSLGKGSSGNIQIKADDSLFVSGGSTIASATFGQGNAGSIDIEAGNLVSFDGVGNNNNVSQVSSQVGSLAVAAPEFTGERIGGNINIKAGSLLMSDRAELEASTYGLGNAGNVTVSAKDAVFLTGNANIFSTVEAGGVGKGGNIDINAGTLSLTDVSQLVTITRGASDTQPAGRGDAGNVNLKITGAVDIAGRKNGFSSAIRSRVETGTVGNGGNIIIDAGSFKLRDGAELEASTYGLGNAGNVTVSAKDAVFLTGNANIFSTVEAGGVGKGGNIDINAGTLSLTDVSQLVTITRGASDTQPAGRGDAGNVNLKITGAVDIAGRKNGFSSAIRSRVETGTVGNGGNIIIDAGSFKLRDGAELEASTYGLGNAGNVTVSAKDAVSLTGGDAYILSTVEAGGVGKGGNIDISAGTLSLTNGAQLLTITRGASDTQPAGRGDAGNVNLNVTGAVDITGVKNGFSSGIFSYVDTRTVGNGGNITVDAVSFKLHDGALVNASTYNENTGGNITVNAKIFEALNGGQFTTTTSSNGRAGKIAVNATDKTIISGSDPNYSDRLINFPNRIGNIGANSGLFVSSTGSGITGDIEVNSPKITLDNQGKLNAESASANGGNINVNSDVLLLRRGGQISTNAGTAQSGGDGGNINLNTKFIVAVPKENSDILANAFTGKGGNINIQTQNLFGIEARPKPTEQSDITASSELGIQGQVSIQKPDVDPNRGLVQSPQVFKDKSDEIDQLCGRGKKPLAEFIITGKQGTLPTNPVTNLMQGEIDFNQLATLDESNSTNRVNQIPDSLMVQKPTPNRIVEAQAIVRGADGTLYLVAEAPNVTPSSRPAVSACADVGK